MELIRRAVEDMKIKLTTIHARRMTWLVMSNSNDDWIFTDIDVDNLRMRQIEIGNAIHLCKFKSKLERDIIWESFFANLKGLNCTIEVKKLLTIFNKAISKPPKIATLKVIGINIYVVIDEVETLCGYVLKDSDIEHYSLLQQRLNDFSKIDEIDIKNYNISSSNITHVEYTIDNKIINLPILNGHNIINVPGYVKKLNNEYTLKVNVFKHQNTFSYTIIFEDDDISFISIMPRNLFLNI